MRVTKIALTSVVINPRLDCPGRPP